MAATQATEHFGPLSTALPVLLYEWGHYPVGMSMGVVQKYLKRMKMPFLAQSCKLLHSSLVQETATRMFHNMKWRHTPLHHPRNCGYDSKIILPFLNHGNNNSSHQVHQD